MRADRNLALEAEAREPPIAHERIPERAFGLGRIAAKQPRQAAHRAALARDPALAVLGDQRAQHLGLRAVEHAAARRAFAALGDRGDDAVQRADVLLGRLHAREDVAHVDLHGVALVERAEVFDLLKLALQGGKKREQLLLGRRRRLVGHDERQRTALRHQEILVGHQQHRLREIERGECRVDRKGHDPVGKPDLLVGQPPALAAEQDRHGLAGRDPLGDDRRGLARPQQRLGLIVDARRGRQHEMAVGDRSLQRVVDLDAAQHFIGAGGGALGVDVRPAVARPHQPQPRQPEIRHGARRRADVLAELRLDQHHHRPVDRGP